MWKVGLVGTGFWSEKHLKAWRRIPGVEIHALCNRSPEKLMNKAREFGVPEERCFRTLEDMLRHADIDIVDIVTGPETHERLVALAAEAGKHILCQKPFAPSLEEAERIVESADRHGVRLMVTENWRWLAPFQTLKRLLDEGVAGELRMVRYAHSDLFTVRMSPDKFLPQPFLTKMPRLIFYEMGAHWFDTWRFLFGEPERLYAEMRRHSPYVAGEDAGVVTLSHGRFYGILDVSWATRRDLTEPLEPDAVLAHHKESVTIDGDKATIILDVYGNIFVIDDAGNKTAVAEGLTLDHEESHFRLQSHFIECLETGREFQTSGADNLKTLRLAFSAYRSAEEHAAVRLDGGDAAESGGRR